MEAQEKPEQSNEYEYAYSRLVEFFRTGDFFHLNKFVGYAELSRDEAALVTSKKVTDRMQAVRQHIGVDMLLFDADPHVREVIAEEGFFLNLLRDDSHPMVRAAVASYGVYLDSFATDPHPWVRAMAAMKMRDPDRLIDDPSLEVKQVLIARGIGLDKFANDPDPDVQYEVYKQRPLAFV